MRWTFSAAAEGHCDAQSCPKKIAKMSRTGGKGFPIINTSKRPTLKIHRQMNRRDCNMAKFRFTVGPWNVHEGNETFGPGIRPSIPLEEKIKTFADP